MKNSIARFSLSAVVVTLLSIGVSVFAASNEDRVLENVPEAEAAKILEQLKLARPDFSYSEIRYAPFEGLYQVQVLGGLTLFTSADAKLIIYGDLYSVENNSIRPYEHPSAANERAKVMAAVSPEDLIVFPAKGDRKAYINVFTDTTCGYCRQLHNEIGQITELGIEVRYLAYPREGIGSAGYQQMVTAWCSSDPKEALTRLKGGERLPMLDCDKNPVARQYEFGQSIGVGATPTLITEKGQILPGYVPAAELAHILGVQ